MSRASSSYPPGGTNGSRGGRWRTLSDMAGGDTENNGPRPAVPSFSRRLAGGNRRVRKPSPVRSDPVIRSRWQAAPLVVSLYVSSDKRHRAMLKQEHLPESGSPSPLTSGVRAPRDDFR